MFTKFYSGHKKKSVQSASRLLLRSRFWTLKTWFPVIVTVLMHQCFLVYSNSAIKLFRSDIAEMIFVRKWHEPLLMSVSKYDRISPSALDYVYFFIFHMHGESLLLFGWLVSTHVWHEPCVIFRNFHALCVCVVGKTLLSTALVPTFFFTRRQTCWATSSQTLLVYIYLSIPLSLLPSLTQWNIP